MFFTIFVLAKNESEYVEKFANPFPAAVKGRLINLLCVFSHTAKTGIKVLFREQNFVALPFFFFVSL